MKQLEIFGANQFQYSKSIIGVYHKPLSNISFSILAPLPLNCLRSAYTVSSEHPVKIRCFAIDDSGLIIVAPLLKFKGDCEKLLSQLSECIEDAKQNHFGSNAAIKPILMEKIKDPAFWNLHKKTPSSVVEQWLEVSKSSNCHEPILIDDFYDNLSDQLIENIDDSIKFLNPIIKEMMDLRPNLDLIIISNFMSRAKAYGGNALAYAHQALRIEPIPILRLIACEPSNMLIETIFSGESLPKALSKHLSLNSTIIKHLSRNVMAIPDMSTTIFITALEAIKNLESKFWPQDKRTWEYLIERIEEWYLITRNETIPGCIPLFEAVLTSFKLIYNRHGLLVWQNRLVNHAPCTSIEKSTLVLYECVENIIPELELLADSKGVDYKTDNFSYRFAISFLEKKPFIFCKEWFNHHPNLEPIYIDRFKFQIVNSLSACNYYGKVFNNCLKYTENILLNLFPNKMLFCISDNSKTLALLTVAIDEVYSGANTHHQLKGVNNSEVGEKIKKACVRFMIVLDTHKDKMRNFYLLSNGLHLFQKSHNRVN